MNSSVNERVNGDKAVTEITSQESSVKLFVCMTVSDHWSKKISEYDLTVCLT